MGLNPSGRAEPGGRRWFFQLDGRTCSVFNMIPLSRGGKTTEGFARGLPEREWAGGMGISPPSVSPSEQGQPQTWARSILGACCCFSSGFETSDVPTVPPVWQMRRARRGHPMARPQQSQAGGRGTNGRPRTWLVIRRHPLPPRAPGEGKLIPSPLLSKSPAPTWRRLQGTPTNQLGNTPRALNLP